MCSEYSTCFGQTQHFRRRCAWDVLCTCVCVCGNDSVASAYTLTAYILIRTVRYHHIAPAFCGPHHHRTGRTDDGHPASPSELCSLLHNRGDPRNMCPMLINNAPSQVPMLLGSWRASHNTHTRVRRVRARNTLFARQI